MRPAFLPLFFFGLAAVASLPVHSEVGDPQLKTDHPFYPGELACSTFPRLFASEAEQYARITGAPPKDDQERALAAWFWRNTHYFHGEEGAQDTWGRGFTNGGDLRTREYWTGLFAHGFGLCGTTHSQWTAELNELLGPGRARGVGVEGHNSFEVFLKGGAYGDGQWALLDHDISTVVFDPAGKKLLSIHDINRDVKTWTDRNYLPAKQHGWLVCGLYPQDGGVYNAYTTAEYFPGYAGPPPMVHLRRGETLRRYLEPGLEDGKTFVFWGRNYNTDGIPGPERSITWVNQPEKMYQSKEGAGYKPGQARYGNAVYTYKPDFKSGDFREGIVEETTHSVTFEFRTPYIIGATPPNSKDWGIYDEGCKNGFVIESKEICAYQLTLDDGQTLRAFGLLMPKTPRDLTDFVKGHQQYRIKFLKSAHDLADSGLTLRTVCQAAIGILPRLKEQGSEVTFEASGSAITSIGAYLPQIQPHIISGALNSPTLTIEITTPKFENAIEIHAAAHIASGNPPSSEVRYQIEFSTDLGKTWQPIVKDWSIQRQGDEPSDFWSQSLCYGSAKINVPASKALVRFKNNGGKNYLRAEAHLIYAARKQDATKVTFNWKDSAGDHTESETCNDKKMWALKTAKDVHTRWIEMEPVGN